MELCGIGSDLRGQQFVLGSRSRPRVYESTLSALVGLGIPAGRVQKAGRNDLPLSIALRIANCWL